MLNPQMTSSQMELLPLVCLCLLSWSGTTSADQPETVVVEEGSDVVLKCSINVNMETGAFEWTKGQKEVFTFDAGQYSQDEQFKGRVSHFQDELKNGNTAIKITNATMDDSGDYTCEFPNNHPSPTFNVKLVVVTGAAPKPSVTTLHETENSALLQCEAHGVPEPEVHWQDSDGNILTAEKPQVTERGGRKYITLKTTVTKTDKFSCVATQKKLSHTISSQIYVLLNVVVKVEEGSDVILPCSPNFNIESETFHWKKDGQKVFKFVAGQQSDDQAEQFKGRVSHFQHELKHGNASIKITKAKVADSGDYTCVFPNLQPSPTFKIELLVVDYTGWKIVAGVFIFLFIVAVVVVVGVLLYKCYTKQKHKKELQEKDRIIEGERDRAIEEVQENKKTASEANEKMKKIDEELQRINTIISEVQENKMSASAACEEIKTINEELQKIIKHPSAACEEIKKIDEGLQKIIKRPSGSSDHPPESVPLYSLNSSD